MGNNGFNMNDQEYEKIKTNAAYFRGRVVEKLNNLETEVKSQSNVDERIKKELENLPCQRHGARITFVFFLVAVLFVLLGYTKFPIILKFFGI